VIVNNGGASLDLQETGATIPLRIISPGKNIGSCIRHTGAALSATLNDDTEPDSGWLSVLVAELKAAELKTDARVGMCASSIRLFLAEVDTLDSAGMLICLDGSSKQRGGRMPPGKFARTEEVLFPSACAALYRRRCWTRSDCSKKIFFYTAKTQILVCVPAGPAGIAGTHPPPSSTIITRQRRSLFRH
jgi:hypothetical protein